ncbi:UV DNA damage repair endonuclease UvsE [Paenibacillus senegalensis]|uniref:UV DNA damage repair endonuclease UvsE n=1 Tax=Paenibacillus senegalensis TaxID=1465766 RepID=UPI000288A51C|nr:UV DNA damage repair endonuclease UvsE [Paenibacillus senegalensis]
MIVRFGYVAMSVMVKNASPSKTMTATHFSGLEDREAAVRKLERIAMENLHNTLRLLRHNRAYDIKLYRFSSKLIPLIGHELLEGWDPFPQLAASFQELGEYVRLHKMRTSFHPDHFTVLSSPREQVIRQSMQDLHTHVRMLDAMGLDETAKCNIHIGGTYGDRKTAIERFIKQFRQLDPAIQRRITLENDDKTFTALETLTACEEVGVPMVLDIHHHQVNDGGIDAVALWSRIQRTWENEPNNGVSSPLPPKIHVSSPKSEKEPRAHADYVDKDQLLGFLRSIADQTPRVDVMIEAKQKDGALFRLMEELAGEEGVTAIDQAAIEL